MNTLNQHNMTINDKPIKKVERKYSSGFYFTTLVKGAPRKHHASNLIDYIDECNENGWIIKEAIMYILPKSFNNLPAYLYNKR